MPAKPTKHASGRWYVRVELPPDPATGQRRQKSLYGATRREVTEQQLAFLRELAPGMSLEPSTLTVRTG
jgi:hypothetical protein